MPLSMPERRRSGAWLADCLPAGSGPYQVRYRLPVTSYFRIVT